MKKSSQSLLSPLVIIFILTSFIIGFALGSFIKFDKSNSLSLSNYNKNWTTYKNNDYGFSFKYPEELIFEDITGGSDIENVPWKISLTSPTSVISSSVQKRQCNTSTGLPETAIKVGNQSGVRILEENQFDGKLFSNDRVEVELDNNLCFVLQKYVNGKDASMNESENISILKELTSQDKDIFNSIISSINFD